MKDKNSEERRENLMDGKDFVENRSQSGQFLYRNID